MVWLCAKVRTAIGISWAGGLGLLPNLSLGVKMKFLIVFGFLFLLLIVLIFLFLLFLNIVNNDQYLGIYGRI